MGEQTYTLRSHGSELDGDLFIPSGALGLILFAHR